MNIALARIIFVSFCLLLGLFAYLAFGGAVNSLATVLLSILWLSLVIVAAFHFITQRQQPPRKHEVGCYRYLVLASFLGLAAAFQLMVLLSESLAALYGGTLFWLSAFFLLAVLFYFSMVKQIPFDDVVLYPYQFLTPGEARMAARGLPRLLLRNRISFLFTFLALALTAYIWAWISLEKLVWTFLLYYPIMEYRNRRIREALIRSLPSNEVGPALMP